MRKIAKIKEKYTRHVTLKGSFYITIRVYNKFVCEDDKKDFVVCLKLQKNALL